MSSIKLMMNVGKNTVSDYAIPKRETVSKNKVRSIRNNIFLFAYILFIIFSFQTEF
jgi:hypothetical protein